MSPITGIEDQHLPGIRCFNALNDYVFDLVEICSLEKYL